MPEHSFITLKTQQSIHRLSVEKIAYVICDLSVCDVSLIDGATYTVLKPLRYFETVLPDSVFVRINRNVIININQILKIHPEGVRKRICELPNGKVFPVSYRRWASLRRLIHI